MIKGRTTTMRGAKRQGCGESKGMEMLDRLIGDALVGAMILLGFVLCLGAARAETIPNAQPGPAIDLVGR
jgi:hypothetical protein